MTNRIALSTGTIEYADTGGESPAIVLLPGLMMNDPRRAGAGAGARTPAGRA